MRVHGAYEIDDAFDRLDFVKAQAMLSQTYWSPGVTEERVVRAAEGSSMVVGAYFRDEMVGYLRVISDRTTFAWISDVIVDEAHRGKGIAQAMTEYATSDPGHQGLRRWILATRDAHRVYEKCGFHLLTNPERWMAYYPPGSIGPV